MDSPDYIVDIAGVHGPDEGPRDEEGQSLRGRPWLAIHWRCCGVYTRIYRNREGTAYDGRCPHCQRPVHIRVGPGGSTSRFFEAY